MKVIIAGSRDIEDYELVKRAIAESGFKITEVVSGDARGPDQLGEAWADDNNVPVTLFPAKWNVHGKKAGMIRNEEMAAYAQALIAIWDGKSSGTRHMIQIARNRNLLVYVLNVGI